MGFRVKKGNQYFGQYKIEDASDDFSNFSLKNASQGNASFIGWATAAIEKKGRFIELTRTIDYDSFPDKQVLEFKIETLWSLYIDKRHNKMHGTTHSQLKSNDKYIENEELRHIYLRKRSGNQAKKRAAEKKEYILNNEPRIRPELLDFDYFETGIQNFDKFFGIKIGSLRVQKGLSNAKTKDIFKRLRRWKKIIYDIIVDDEAITVRINPKRIAGYPFNYLGQFSKILPQLIDDLVSFAGSLENVLLSNKLDYKKFLTVEQRYVTFYSTGKCEKCSQNIPINGPVSKIVCKSCKTENILDINDMWRKILYFPYHNIETKKHKFDCDELSEISLSKLKWEAKAPFCRHCKTMIPEKILVKQPLNKYSEFKCPNCNSINYSFPPSEWIKKIMPFIDLIYNGHLEVDDINIDSSINKSIPWTIAYWFRVNKKE